MPSRIRFGTWISFVLALIPALAFAQATTQLRLSWDHCAAEGYVADRSFDCSVNTGEDVLFASAVLGDEVQHAGIAAFEAYIDFRATSQNLPSWWQVSSGMCRTNTILLKADGLVASPLCTPWYLAGGTEPLVVSLLEYGNDGTNASRLHFAAEVPAGSEVTIPNGPQEYLFARVRILRSKSTGAGSCSGCSVPVCIGFGQLQFQYPGAAPRHTILGTTASTVTWQGAYVSSYQPVPGHQEGTGYVFYHGNLGCATGPVPAQSRTWGVIKTMYR